MQGTLPSHERHIHLKPFLLGHICTCFKMSLYSSLHKIHGAMPDLRRHIALKHYHSKLIFWSVVFSFNIKKNGSKLCKLLSADE